MIRYAAMGSEKRRFPRVNWLTEARILCRDEDVNWNVRLTDISEGGCFVDTLVPLTEGSPVSLQVTDAMGTLDLPGKILYGQPTIGSAISFDPMDATTLARLRRVIEKASAG